MSTAFVMFHVNFVVSPITSLPYCPYVFSPCLHNILHYRYFWHFFLSLSLTYKKCNPGTVFINFCAYILLLSSLENKQDTRFTAHSDYGNYRLHFHTCVFPECIFVHLYVIMFHRRVSYEYHLV